MRALRGLLPLLLVALCAAEGSAAAPPARLSPQQRAKLAERDRLVKLLPGLLQKRQAEKLVAAMERIAALEKEVLGETHPEVIGWLQTLADVREARGQFPEALRLR